MAADEAKLGFVKRSMSLESTASIGSPGADSRTATEQFIEDDLPGLYNSAGALLFCPRHKKYGLEKISTKSGLKDGLWFPHSFVGPSDTYMGAIKRKLNVALAAPGTKAKNGYLQYNEPQLIEMEYLQLPGIEKWIKRFIYKVVLNLEDKPTHCCNNATGLVWLDKEDIEDGADGAPYWGPEPTYLHHASVAGVLNKLIMTELRLEDVLQAADHPLRQAANYSDDDVMRIYSEYIQHCYPSRFMNYKAFETYMCKAGLIAGNEAQSFFRAFAADGTHFLTFKEFLLGLAAGDPGTPHDGGGGVARSAYILRYFDTDRDELLRREDVRAMVSAIYQLKKKPGDAATIAKETEDVFTSMRIPPKAAMTFQQAALAIGTLKIRGTASLFRFYKSFQGAAKIPLILYPIIDEHFEIIVGGKRAETKCPKCEQISYAYGQHIPLLSVDGVHRELQKITTGNDDVAKAPNDLRRKSELQFHIDSMPNTVLDWVRDLSEVNKVLTNTTRLPKFQKGKVKSFYSLDRKMVVTTITSLCDAVESILLTEHRMIKIKSPVTVFGGIHGSLKDLMVFERQFWKKSPMLEASQFLFLGDFIGEKSHYNLEVVLYLFALKLQTPRKVHLVRGNYELRGSQAGLIEESAAKLGDAGKKVWERINKVFDALPVCALVDKGVFCAHGGIPRSVSKLEDLANIPCPLANPETQSPAAWEMLWSEPLTDAEVTKRRLNPVSGFVSNVNNGNKGLLFTNQAVTAFLNNNKLSNFIRTHEGAIGLEYRNNDKMITVQSSTNYGGSGNKACVVLLNRGKARGIRVDTNFA